MPSRTGRT